MKTPSPKGLIAAVAILPSIVFAIQWCEIRWLETESRRNREYIATLQHTVYGEHHHYHVDDHHDTPVHQHYNYGLEARVTRLEQAIHP